MSEPETAAGRALVVAEPDALQLEADFLDMLPGSLGDDPEIEAALAHLTVAVRQEARATADAALAAEKERVARLRAMLELKPYGTVGPEEVPWFRHGGISHGEGAECVVCALLANPAADTAEPQP